MVMCCVQGYVDKNGKKLWGQRAYKASEKESRAGSGKKRKSRSKKAPGGRSKRRM